MRREVRVGGGRREVGAGGVIGEGRRMKEESMWEEEEGGRMTR